MHRIYGMLGSVLVASATWIEKNTNAIDSIAATVAHKYPNASLVMVTVGTALLMVSHPIQAPTPARDRYTR